MAFTLPTFNLACNVWRFGTPTSDPPDDVFMCNLTPGRRSRGVDGMNEPLVAAMPGMFLLIPINTDLRGDFNTAGSPDTVEVAAGDGWIYTVHYVDRVARGFPNEHMFAEILLAAASPPPPVTGFVLLESGDFVLLESGDKIKVE